MMSLDAASRCHVGPAHTTQHSCTAFQEGLLIISDDAFELANGVMTSVSIGPWAPISGRPVRVSRADKNSLRLTLTSEAEDATLGAEKTAVVF